MKAMQCPTHGVIRKAHVVAGKAKCPWCRGDLVQLDVDGLTLEDLAAMEPETDEEQLAVDMLEVCRTYLARKRLKKKRGW